MANQAPTVSVNYDAASISGLASGESITMTGAGLTLTMDSDSLWAQQAASFGAINYESCNVAIDGTQVWWLPYDGGTGNVPALGTYETPTVITSSGGATGVFLGVWTALGVAPTAAGTAMPATGFIKLRRVTSGAYADNETLNAGGGTIATVNSTTGGQRGWLILTQSGGSSGTVDALSTLSATGSRFTLGVTSGSRGQTVQYFAAALCNGLWIETGAGTGVYEHWSRVVDAAWTTAYVDTDSTRGRLFKCSSAGVITLNSATIGYLPASGCKIQCANLHFAVTYLLTADVSTYPPSTFSVINSHCSAITIPFSRSLHMSGVVTDSTFFGNVTHLEDSILTAAQVDLSTQAALVADNVSFIYITNITTFQHILTFTGTGSFVFSGSRVLASINADNNVNADASIRFELSFFSGNLRAGASIVLVDCLFSGYPVGDANTAAGFVTSFYASLGTFRVDDLDVLADDQAPTESVFVGSGARVIDIRNIGSAASPLLLGTVAPPYWVIDPGSSDYNSILGKSVQFAVSRVYTTTPLIEWLATELLPYTHFSVDGLVISNSGDVNYAAPFVVQVTNTILRGIRFEGTIYDTTAALGGSHFVDGFTSATTGTIAFLAHARTTYGTSATAWAVTGGAPTALGTSRMTGLPAVGDEITAEWPFYILGHTGFAAADAVIDGTNTANMVAEYAIKNYGDAAYGTFKTATSANLSAETITDPDLGFKLKVRIRCTTANTTNAIHFVQLATTTTLAYQESGLYPIDVATITITVKDKYGAAVEGAMVAVYEAGVFTPGSELVAPTATNASGIATAEVEYLTDKDIVIRVRKNTSTPRYLNHESVGAFTSTGFSSIVTLARDTIAT